MSTNQASGSSRLAELPIYPLLFAVFIPINLLAQNITLFVPGQAVRSVLAFLFVAVVLTVLADVLLRRRHSAALLVMLLFVGVWVYQFGTPWRLLYGAMVLIAIVLAWRNTIKAKFTHALNLVMLAVLLQPIALIVRDQWLLEERDAGILSYSPFINAQPVAGEGALPVIVHIVLDGYANRDVLDTVMGFDNSGFEQALQELGFVVASDARTPYNQTLMVMAAIFAGDYLDPGKSPLVSGDGDRAKTGLGRVVSDGPVKAKLAELGYQFLYTDPGFNFWQFGGDDLVSAPPIGFFTPSVYEQLLIERTAVNFIPRVYNRILGRPNFLAVRQGELTRYALDTDFYNQYTGPYQLYAHVVAPHPPFNIDREGRNINRWGEFLGMADGAHATFGVPELQKRYIEGYLEKLRFVNQAVLRQINRMLRDIPQPKIIMIHGDHGGGAYYFPEDPERSCLNERYRPFLAVYSDDSELQDAFAALATQRFNLVNLYRVVFDARFATGLGLAPDQSWFNNWDEPQRPLQLDDEQIALSCKL